MSAEPFCQACSGTGRVSQFLDEGRDDGIPAHIVEWAECIECWGTGRDLGGGS